MMMCAKTPPALTPFRYFADFVDGRRGEILDAALAVFGDKGYESGTMREIAARVGVSEPAIYRHYESKEAILTDIVATAGDRIAGEMHRGLAAVNRDNIVERLHDLIELRRRGVDGQAVSQGPDVFSGRGGAGAVMHILFHAAPHNETFTTAMRTHIGRPMVEGVRELIPRIDASYGIARAPDEVESLVRVFMSLFAGYFTTQLMFDHQPNDDAIVKALLAIMGWTPAAPDATQPAT
jgi:AcrR family transcriptional regulator